MKPQKKKVIKIFESDIFGFKRDKNLSEEQKRSIEEQLDKEFVYILQKRNYRGQKVEGKYLIAYSLEFARRLIYPGEEIPKWQDLRDENAHIGIAVHDATDYHFIEGLSVTVTLIDKKGFVVGSFDHPLLKRPDLYHYGRNWVLPGAGMYTLHVKVETPGTMLQDESSGKLYTTPAEVEFKNVKINTGQKIS